MTIFSDNFDDNILDTNKWLKVWWASVAGDTGDAVERNQRLELVVEGTYEGYGNVGVVSRDRYDLRKGKVQAYITNVSNFPDRVMILISPTRITNAYVLDLSDYYIIELDKFYDYFRVTRKVAGTSTRLYQATAVAMSEPLKIEIEAGIIRFYEGTLLRVYEAYALPSYECYIYLLRVYRPQSATSFQWIDDFYCEYAGTTEEKQEAQTLITQQKITEFIETNWLPLSILGIILAIIISIILGVW